MGKFYEGLAEQLTKYVRFTAWLNTAPVEPQRAKAPKGPDVSPVSRLEKLRADKKEPAYTPVMPEVHGGEFVLWCFWDAGPTFATPMGAAPLTHGEIRAWQDNTGTELQPWQARLLRRLSSEYLAECARAEKPDAPSPLAIVLTDEERARVSKKVSEGMRMLMNTRPKT